MVYYAAIRHSAGRPGRSRSNAGILDADEIREEEGWNPRGDAARPAARNDSMLDVLASRDLAMSLAEKIEAANWRVPIFDDKGEPVGARPATPEERAKLRLLRNT